MSIGSIIGLAIGGIVLITIIALVIWLISTYNTFVKMRNNVEEGFSTMDVYMKKRYDLIPNLVATVKGYASHESSTLENVIAARANATRISIDPEKLTEKSIEEFNKAQGELSSAIGRLLMITENYPDLKANQNFLELQAQLEGTENRISTERMKFNEAAKSYNTMIRQFPKNILASMFNFEKKGYFEAQKGSETAPKVEF